MFKINKNCFDCPLLLTLNVEMAYLGAFLCKTRNSRFKNPLTTPICLVCPRRLQLYTPAPPSYPYELLQLSVGRAPGDQDILMQSETMRWVGDFWTIDNHAGNSQNQQSIPYLHSQTSTPLLLSLQHKRIDNRVY